MSHENNIQVKEGYYTKRAYNTLERFISYFYQIDSVVNLSLTQSVLEIGPGSRLVSEELKRLGYAVTTCDFDPQVAADITADIRALPCTDASFDCIMACQVLEHIPYTDFEKVLADFSRISKRFVVISLPERSVGMSLVLKVPFIRSFFRKDFFDWSVRIPVRFKGFQESGQHYWEIDTWTTSKQKVRHSMQQHFTILKEFRPPLNKYHRFFILEKHGAR